MLTLPSGRLIDLSTDRSKHHALRLPGVSPSSSHRELYSVVDIIYRHSDDGGIPKRGWTEYDYDFSGYTLDTVRFDSDWSDADKAVLYKWVRLDQQRRSIETARRRLIDHQQHLSVKLYPSSQHLYSLMESRVMNLPLQSATPEHWLATINNMKQCGVREEEIQWSGLRQYLKQQLPDKTINKTKLLQNQNYKHIRLELSTEIISGSSVKLNFKEVAKRMPHQAVYRATLKLQETCLCILRFVDSRYNYRIGVVRSLNNNNCLLLNKHWFALDPYGRAIANKNLEGDETSLFFENSIDAKKAAEMQAHTHSGKNSGICTHTHFDHLTLFGGNDYREWMVSLPDYQRIFFGAHFFDHNILAHIRTTTRIDSAGHKILFIEEVQSDWHQSGKRHGYDNNAWGQVANAPFKLEWPVLAVKLMLIHASQSGFSGIAWTMGDIHETRYMKHLKPVKQHYDKEIPKALNRLCKAFNSHVETTVINTRDPWLNLEKTQDKWRVFDGQGKFRTRAKYNSRDDAMAVMARHSRVIDLRVPVLFISDSLRRQISEKGLPLFGTTID